MLALYLSSIHLAVVLATHKRKTIYNVLLSEFETATLNTYI